MANDGGIVDDANYDNLYIVDRYKKSLQGGLGNLVSRIIRGKKWDVRESVCDAEKSARNPSRSKVLESNVIEKAGLGQTSSSPVDTTGNRERALLRTQMENTPRLAARHMEELNPKRALHSIMELVYSVMQSSFDASTLR
jgi:methionyl-tRNA synthetase